MHWPLAMFRLQIVNRFLGAGSASIVINALMDSSNALMDSSNALMESSNALMESSNALIYYNGVY